MATAEYSTIVQLDAAHLTHIQFLCVFSALNSFDISEFLCETSRKDVKKEEAGADPSS